MIGEAAARSGEGAEDVLHVFGDERTRLRRRRGAFALDALHGGFDGAFGRGPAALLVAGADSGSGAGDGGNGGAFVGAHGEIAAQVAGGAFGRGADTLAVRFPTAQSAA